MTNAFLNELPYYYSTIREFKELSQIVAQDWEKIDQALELVTQEQFIMTSSEAGVARRELEFGIVADPVNEPLRFRKLRLLSYIQSNPPFTLEYLKNMLDSLLGETNHEIFLDVDTFEMELSVYSPEAVYYKEVERLAERIVPLNIDLVTSIVLIREYMILRFGAYGFDMNYKRTNKFHTEAVPGTGRLEDNLIAKYGAYAFDALYPKTNKFSPTASPGMVVDEQEISLKASAYAFAQGLPITGKFIAKEGW